MGAEGGQTARQTQVRARLDQLEIEIDSIGQITEELEARLQPCLRSPDPGGDIAKEPDEPEPLVPLAEVIQSRSSQLHAVLVRLRGMRDRLEL